MVHLRQKLKFNLVHQSWHVKSENIERFPVNEVFSQIFQPVENLFGVMLKSPKVLDYFPLQPHAFVMHAATYCRQKTLFE